MKKLIIAFIMSVLFVAIATLGADYAKESPSTQNTNIANVNKKINENTNNAEAAMRLLGAVYAT